MKKFLFILIMFLLIFNIKNSNSQWVYSTHFGTYYISDPPQVGIGDIGEPGIKLKLSNTTDWGNVLKFADTHGEIRFQGFGGTIGSNDGLLNIYTDNSNFVTMDIKNDHTIAWNDDKSYLSPDQGGSIELNTGSETGKTPFIDFHFGLGYLQDYNTRIINTPNNQMEFWTNYNNNTRIMTLKEDRVGINTNNPDPAYKLSVNGHIRATEIKVETGWSDFVFKPSYELRTLDEVEGYIKENGHLADIPSEQEVSENGVELGNMTSKLLQKVEVTLPRKSEHIVKCVFDCFQIGKEKHIRV